MGKALAVRRQAAGIELDELRQVLGAVELNKMGGIKEYLLVPYKNLKARAIDPAVKELNANTEVSISYAEHKDGKRVVALTFLFRQNSKNAAKPEQRRFRPTRKWSWKSSSCRNLRRQPLKLILIAKLLFWKRRFNPNSA